jgi:hypothetical protein
MVVELSHEVVVSFMTWLFREATTTNCSLIEPLVVASRNLQIFKKANMKGLHPLVRK